jgi:hypothetical protein
MRCTGGKHLAHTLALRRGRRNVDEVLRVIDLQQLTAKHATP